MKLVDMRPIDMKLIDMKLIDMKLVGMKWLALPLLALILAACSTAPKKLPPPASTASGKHSPAPPQSPTSAAGCKGKYAPAQEDLSKRGDYKAGGLYAPGVADTTPDHVPDVDCIAEPAVTDEPRSPVGNRSPYSVLGKKYEVMPRVDGYVERGTASYYGNKFHGRRTSNQEVYDMYAFTAAHKTLPLPSFARVTNLDNGKSVVVRVNDRGPFHEGRVIDLSYAAAVKLGITQRGTGRVEVRALTGKEKGNRAQASATSAPDRTSLATGLPARIANSKPTAMDELVGKLPQAASASTPMPLAAQPSGQHLVPAPRQIDSADKFDAWMREQGVRVATGKPLAVETRAATTVAVPATTAMPAQAISSGDVQLQVASFVSRENAERALARLSAAGIARALLSNVASNGRTLWRLRVLVADPAMAAELAGRIAGLGFGQPQLVRE